MAVSLSFKEWEVSEEENELLSTQGDDVLAEFFPQVQNKYGKLIAFLFTFLSVFGGKYFKWDKHIKKENRNREPDKKENEVKTSSVVTVRDGV